MLLEMNSESNFETFWYMLCAAKLSTVVEQIHCIVSARNIDAIIFEESHKWEIILYWHFRRELPFFFLCLHSFAPAIERQLFLANFEEKFSSPITNMWSGVLLFLSSCLLLSICHSHVEPIRRRPVHMHIPFESHKAKDSSHANEKIRLDHEHKQTELQTTANLAAQEKERHAEESLQAKLSEQQARTIAGKKHALKIAEEEEVSARKIAEEEARLYGKIEAKEAAQRAQMLARAELLQRAEESARISQLAEEMAARERVKQEAEAAAVRVLAEKQTALPSAAEIVSHNSENEEMRISGVTSQRSGNDQGAGEMDKVTIDSSATRTAQLDQEDVNVIAEDDAISEAVLNIPDASAHKTLSSVLSTDTVVKEAAGREREDAPEKDVQGVGGDEENVRAGTPETADESIQLSMDQSIPGAKKTRQLKLLRKQQKAAAFAELAELNRAHKERKSAAVPEMESDLEAVELREQLKRENLAADAEATELKLIRKQQKAVAAAEAAERKLQEKELKAAARLSAASISKEADSSIAESGEL